MVSQSTEANLGNVRRAVTRLVNARLHDGSEVVGRVLESDETGVLLEVNVKPPKPGMRTDKVVDKRFEFAAIARARVEIEFNRKGEEELEDVGFVYYGRHFRSADGTTPPIIGPLLQAYGTVSVLTLPADNGGVRLAF